MGLLVALGWALQLAVSYLGKGGGQEVVFATHTPWISGYFDAAKSDVGPDAAALLRFLRAYPDYIQRLPMTGPMIHVGQHPPGGVVFYWTLLRLCESSPGLTETLLRAGDALTVGGADAFELAKLAAAPFERAAIWASFFVLAGACALTAAPVYLLARQEAGPRAGLAAAGLCLTMPSLHLFAPHVDQSHLLLSATVAAVWAWGLRRGSWWRTGLAGAGLGLCLAVGLHFVALAGVCALSAVLWARGREDTWGRVCRRSLGPLLGLAGGLLLVVLGQYVLLGHHVLRVWWICLAKHETFYDHFPRTYWKWLLANGLEFGLFTGVGTVLMAALWLTTACGALRRREETTPAASVALASAAVLVLLNLSGKNLSEVARLWMFLMPVGAAAGGAALARLGRLAPARWVWLVVAAQFVQAVVFKLRLDVFSIY